MIFVLKSEILVDQREGNDIFPVFNCDWFS